MTRLRGFIWLAAGLLVALIAGFVAFVTLSRASTLPASKNSANVLQTAEVQVIVASRQIEVRSALTKDDLKATMLPVNAVPEGSIQGIDDAIGQITAVDLFPGEILLSQRLIDPNVTSADGKKALVVADDEVLMAFPANDLMSRTGVLKAGDQVDLLFSLKFPVEKASLGSASGGVPGYINQSKEQLTTFNVLQNLTIAAVVEELKPSSSSDDRSSTAILLTVSPQDALVLKYVKDAEGVMDIVLRAPEVDTPFESDPVDVDYLINRYRIPAASDRYRIPSAAPPTPAASSQPGS